MACHAVAKPSFAVTAVPIAVAVAVVTLKSVNVKTAAVKSANVLSAVVNVKPVMAVAVTVTAAN